MNTTTAIDRGLGAELAADLAQTAFTLAKRFAAGVEYRTKPNNLGLKEDDWKDVFVAYALNKHLSVTAAYVDLGEIATFRNERGAYLSLQAGF